MGDETFTEAFERYKQKICVGDINQGDCDVLSVFRVNGDPNGGRMPESFIIEDTMTGQWATYVREDT